MVCMNCGRRLKDTKSIERGQGPVCWRKNNPKTEKKKNINSDGPVVSLDIPGQISFSDLE